MPRQHRLESDRDFVFTRSYYYGAIEFVIEVESFIVTWCKLQFSLTVRLLLLGSINLFVKIFVLLNLGKPKLKSVNDK